jgi:hypothetical protein
VAKRVRGSGSSYRPGGQGPSRTKKSDEETTSDAGSESTTDIDGAVETVEGSYTEIALEEAAPAKTKSRRARRAPKVKADSLSSRSAAENVYVREDLRRIGIVSVILIGMLAIAWVLFYVMDLLGLY